MDNTSIFRITKPLTLVMTTVIILILCLSVTYNIPTDYFLMSFPNEIFSVDLSDLEIRDFCFRDWQIGPSLHRGNHIFVSLRVTLFRMVLRNPTFHSNIPITCSCFSFFILVLWLIYQIGQIYLNYGDKIAMYESFVASLTYIYCKRFPSQPFRMMFMLQMNASSFPWFYVFFKIVTGRSWNLLLVGFLVGHLYYYLADVLPAIHKIRIFYPPKIWFF